MSNDVFSQEEIDKLLQATSEDKSQLEMMKEEKEKLYSLSQEEMDVIGELANISFGSASTALSTMLNKQVSITTPKVEVIEVEDGTDGEDQQVVLTVDYVKGLYMQNIFVIKKHVALVIADLMMMGSGEVDENNELTDMELSAVQEAMNQMMGSAATAMSEMFQEVVDISPPEIKVKDINAETQKLSEDSAANKVARISFDLEIGGFLKSKLVQIVTMENAKQMAGKLLKIMTGPNEEETINDIEVSTNVKELTESFTTEMVNVLSMIINRTAKTESFSYKNSLQNTQKKYMMSIHVEEDVEGEFYVVFDQKFASVISDLMMMGPGEPNKEIGEMELSALQEAFNQMFQTGMNKIRNDTGKEITMTLGSIEVFDEGLVNQYGVYLLIEQTIDLEVDTVTLSAVFNEEMNNKIFGKLVDIDKDIPETKIENDTSEVKKEPVSIKPLLNDIEVRLDVVFGKTQKSLKQLLSMNFGEVISLKENVDDPLFVYANGVLVAEGAVVNADGYFGVKVTKVY